MLADLQLTESDLACGPQEPMSARGALALRESGEMPSRLHNNCSGKHAALLARARTAGWQLAGYQKRDHPVQKGCLASVAKWSGIDEREIGQAVDGCGVVEFSLPLQSMARAYARLAASMKRSGEPASRIHQAISTRPFLFGGTGRFDTVLIEQTRGRVFSKVGAEGVHSVAIPEREIGFVIKVEDGAQRAQYPAVIRVLQHLEELPMELPSGLVEFGRRPILNTRGEIVGNIGPAN
jgi:L-asparaginase II